MTSIHGHGKRKPRVYTRNGRTWKRYPAWVDHGYDEFGKRKREEREFATARERDAWLLAMLAGGREADRARRRSFGPTVGEVFEAWYQEGVTVEHWSPSHRMETRRLLDNYLKPLYPLALGQFDVDHAQDAITAMVEAGRSEHSIRRARNIMSAALNFAIRRRQLPPGYNVATPTRRPALPEATPVFLQQQHLPGFLEAIAGDFHETTFKVTMALGLRPGEAIGLRWGDVDLAGATVTVRHTTQRVQGERHDRGTKTGKARVIHLPAEIVEILRAHRSASPIAISRMARVFPGARVEAPTSNYLTTRLHVLVDRWNAQRGEQPALPRVTAYDLRHTAATLLLTLGVPLEQVQEVLGHSTIETTRGYAHIVEEAKRASADTLDRYLSGLRFGTVGGTTGGTTAKASS